MTWLQSGSGRYQVGRRSGSRICRRRRCPSVQAIPDEEGGRAFLVQARNQVAQGVHTPDSVSPTVAEAGEMWLKRCERDKLERTTVLQYRGHLTHHIGPRLGAVKLSRLTVPLINEFADQLLTAGRSRVLVSRIMVSLSSIVTEAQRAGW